MWNSPNQKLKKVQNKKENSRSQDRIPIHFQRINAELKAPTSNASEAITQVRLLLNDLSETGVGLYSPILIHTPDVVSLEIANPLHINIRGRILWCQEFNMSSHILANRQFKYRIGMEFVIETDEEKKAIKELCAHVAKVIETE